MDKTYETKCPVCGSTLYMDDSETEVHCVICGYTSSIEALEMCKYMCPEEDDMMEE